MDMSVDQLSVVLVWTDQVPQVWPPFNLYPIWDSFQIEQLFRLLKKSKHDSNMIKMGVSDSSSQGCHSFVAPKQKDVSSVGLVK